MKSKHIVFQCILLLLLLTPLFAQSNETMKAFHKTTFYLNNGRLMEKMPRSAGSIAVETWQGSISKDETWDKDYIITGDVIIEPTATLTIKPGVTIFFPKMDLDNNNVGDTDFIVKGRLNSQGLPNKKVVFTSYQDNKQNSDWGGIDFEPQTMLLSTISNAEISFAQEAVHINAHNVTFNACHIHDIKTFGIQCVNMEATHKLTIRKTTIESCSSYGVEINNGDIVIADSHFHHNSTCGLKVSQGNVKISNLLIEKIAGDGANFESNVIVNANELKAISNSSDGVKIKCYEKSVFTNCQFMNNNKFGIDITNSSPDIYNCKIDNNKYSGLIVYGEQSNPMITHCSINSNLHTGLFFHENAKGVLTYSTIINNNSFGIKVNDTSSPIFSCNHIYDNKGTENTISELYANTQYFNENDWRWTSSNVYHPEMDLISKRRIFSIKCMIDDDNKSISGCANYVFNLSFYCNGTFYNLPYQKRFCNSFNLEPTLRPVYIDNDITNYSQIFIKLDDIGYTVQPRAWVPEYTYTYPSPSGYQVTAIATPATKINLQNNYWKQKSTASSVNHLIYSNNDNFEYEPYSWEPIPNAGVTLSVSASKSAFGVADSQVAIPINVINYTDDLNIISFNFTLEYNSEILDATGISTLNTLTENWEVFSDTSNLREMTVSGFNLDPLQSGKGTLLYLLFKVKPAAYVTGESPLEFTDFTVNTNITDLVLENGKFVVIRDLHTISGNVTYFKNNEPISQMTLTIDGGEAPIQIQTQNDGSYTFPPLPESNYIVAPSNDAPVPQWVITPYDASLVTRHSLNMLNSDEQLDQNQLYAADVDGDGDVTVFDASVIARYAAGLIHSFDKGAWLFEPRSNAYTLDGDMEKDYQAIVVGDVSGNWKQQADAPGQPISDFSVSLPDISEVSQGDDIVISIHTDNVLGNNIFAYMADIDYNPEVLYCHDISKNNSLTSSWPNPAFYTSTTGNIRIAAFGTAALKGEGDLIHINCQVRGNDDDLSSLMFNHFLFNEGAPQVKTVNGSVLVGENPLSVDPDYLEVPKTTGTTTINIMTGNDRMHWEAFTDTPWISMENDPFGTGNGSIHIQYQNNSGIARSGAITISCTDAANGPQQVEIYQLGMYQLQIGKYSANTGDLMTIPIIMNNPNGEAIEGITIVLEYDPTVLNLSNLIFAKTIIEGNLHEKEFNTDVPGKIELAISIQEPDFTLEGDLVKLKFNVQDKKGASSALKFTKALINEKNASTDDGLLVIGYEITGKIGYYSIFAREVPDVLLKIGERTATSDIYGNYIFKNLPAGGTYQIRPFKSTDLGGLSVQDAAMILKKSVNLQVFDCNQMLSADVTKDGNITATDAAKVAKFAVQYEAGNTDGCLNDQCTHWIFSTQSIDSCDSGMPIPYMDYLTYSLLDSDQENANFFAIKLGDVNGDWTTDPQTRKKQRMVIPTTQTRSLDIPEIHVNPGDNFHLWVMLNESQRIESAMITVRFDEEAINATGGSLQGGILSGFNFQEETGVDHVAVFGIYSSSNVEGNGKLIDINFSAVGNQISTIIELSKLECNDLEASGGFLVNTLTSRQVNVIIDVEAPNISAIANQAINENESLNNIPVTISPSQTPAGKPSLKGISSNESLLPSDNIVFTGTDTIRYLTLTPLTGQHGTSAITLILTDAYGRTHSRTFTLTVHPLPDSEIMVQGCGNIMINQHVMETPWTGQFQSEPQVITLTAIPCEPNWKFAYWSRDVVGNDNPVQVSTTSSKKITAHFIEKTSYVLSVQGESGFNIQVNGENYPLPFEQSFLENTVLELQALPENEFQKWMGDMTDDSHHISLTMNQNFHLTAIFHAFEIVLNSGWSLISLPFIPESQNISDIFPNAEVVYRYANVGYIPVKTLSPGLAYWVKSLEGEMISISGQPFKDFHEVSLKPGWYMIGSMNQPSQPKVTPDDAINVIYRFADGGYVIHEGPLQAGHGYWFKIIKECVLDLE
jgi:hypothetical protein